MINRENEGILTIYGDRIAVGTGYLPRLESLLLEQ